MGLFNKKTKEEKLESKENKANDKAKLKALIKEHGEYITPPLFGSVTEITNPKSDLVLPHFSILKNGTSYIHSLSFGSINVYDFTEYTYVNIEWEEDLITKNTGVSRALGGALLFGPAGAIVGAVTGKDKVKKDKSYLVLTFQNKETLELRAFRFKCDQAGYKQWKRIPTQSLIETQQQSAPVLSNLEQIKQLKELLDMGAINQNEFDNKKAQLL